MTVEPLGPAHCCLASIRKLNLSHVMPLQGTL